MSIWNKVLVGLILVASIAFFILGARALKTHQHWRQQALALEEELAWERDAELVLMEGLDSPEVAVREQEVEKIGGEAGQGIQQGKQAIEGMGEEAKLGLRRAKLALHEQLVDRGRVWRGCHPQLHQETATTGKVIVRVEFPYPHQIQPKTVLWVFDQTDFQQGGSYLGQFTVNAIGGQDNKLLELWPTTDMSGPRPERQAQRQRLQQSAAGGAAWALYEIMPSDDHRSLAGLSDDELKAMKAVLPEETVDEYVTDGQLTTLEDVKQRGFQGKVFKVDGTGQIVKTDGLEVEVQAENEEGKYVRQLRDYEELFRHFDLLWTEGVDREQTLIRNVKYIDPTKLDPQSREIGAQQDADRQVQYRQREHDRLVEEKKELVGDPEENVIGELELVSNHRNALEAKLAAIQAAVDETIKTIRGMAGEIARVQREATRIIDERTRRMARAGAGN